MPSNHVQVFIFMYQTFIFIDQFIKLKSDTAIDTDIISKALIRRCLFLKCLNFKAKSFHIYY